MAGKIKVKIYKATKKENRVLKTVFNQCSEHPTGQLQPEQSQRSRYLMHFL